MKIAIRLSFILLILISCNEKKNKFKEEQAKSEIKYSKHIQIFKKPNYSLVYIINPDANKIEKMYAFSKDISNLKLKKEIIPIQVPIQSITCLAGTDIGMLEKLGVSSKISGVSDIKYVHSKTVKENFSKNKVKSIQNLSQINPESLIEKTNIITYSGFGKSPTNENKLIKFNIHCLPIYDWRELEALGKAEWIKLYGVLFNKEKEADFYFKKIEQEYNHLKKSSKKFLSSESVLSGSMIGDSWYMPAGESFVANLMRDANCIYVNKNAKGTGSSAFTFEHVLREFSNSQIWINPGFKSKNELLQSNVKYQYFDAFKNEKVYCYSHNMNYFWEMGAIEPQNVLSDFIQIFHQDKAQKKKLYFYKKIND
jgi:iron complex transport system substrate-binding protein